MRQQPGAALPLTAHVKAIFLFMTRRWTAACCQISVLPFRHFVRDGWIST